MRFSAIPLLASVLVHVLPDLSATRSPDEAGPGGEAGRGIEDGHRRMADLLTRIAAESGDLPYLGDERMLRLRNELAEISDDTLPERVLRLRVASGLEELRQGHVRRAIEVLRDALDGLAPEHEANRATLAYHLGVAYMRLGEVENCCAGSSPDACRLPIQGGGIHTRPEGSRAAIELFREVVERTPRSSSLHHASRWLLNVAYMTLGEHPHGVPQALEIVPPGSGSRPDFPRFRNVAGELGVDAFDLAGGVVCDDFDGDGYLDIVTSTMDPGGPMHFYRNRRDGGFEDATAAAGLGAMLGGLNLVQADYDNDGDLDVLVLRGAWLGGEGRHPNSLLENDGHGRFRDVTFEVGLGDVHYPTQTAAWADYDNDGDLDLFVGNESSDGLVAPCQLFRSRLADDGERRFTDVARQAGIAYRGFPKAVVWGDYDGDRLPDLYVSEHSGANRLYRNQGDGTFVDVARRLGVQRPRKSFPAWFWDFDNDGALDLFAASYTGRVDVLAAHYAGEPKPFEPPGLYRGDGRGGFRPATRAAGLVLPMLAMGANFGDLDNDGFLDFYLGTGDPDYASLMPNLMFLNRRGRRFVDVTIAGGFGHLQKGHGVAFADLDNDGDLDVYEQMGGAYSGDAFHNVLYENPGFGKGSLTVQLVGTRSNRCAIGARIHARIEGDGKPRSVYRHVSSGGSFGANPLRQTIGLGHAGGAARLEVFWPTTGETQVLEDVPGDRTIRIVEGEPGYETLGLEELELGA